jgi:predicted TPR repeat methyltransferase
VTGSKDTEFFDALYAANPDPWGFETSDYEKAKYDATLAALGTGHFARGLEIGCSIGVLTERLAGRCDALIGVDVAEAALERARARCAGLSHVHLARMRVPGAWPEGRFDLILLSEVLYFLDSADIDGVAERCAASLMPGGVVLLVHWLGDTGTENGGEAASERFIAQAQGRLVVQQQEKTARYRIDRLAAWGKVTELA